ncbi:MAG TPA: flavodoxin family protein [Desulfomonilia bacterium]|nr:flavodoxin family protein [Desulfomonilia bacterium]
MKIMAINGSPRRGQSRTGQILREVLSGARNEGAKTEYLEITGLDIQCCIGCDRCHHLGACAQKDDFNDLFAKMLSSDGIVLGSPVYIFQVTAQLKAFIDRLGHAIHCQRLLGKYGAVVATAGGTGQVETADYQESLLNRMGVQCVGRVACALDDGLIPEGADVMEQALELGRTLAAAIEEKREFPAQIETLSRLRNYFCMIMEKRKDRWDWEYRYWQEKGWL